MQHDRIRLEVIKCHDASFIYSLAALATVPGTGEFLSLYGSENRKCIQGDEDGECVVRYSERLEVAGLALKLLAAKQLQLKDAVTSAASEVHQRCAPDEFSGFLQCAPRNLATVTADL